MAESHVSSLDSLNALSAGASLWVVPPLARSTWTKKIDWYLNFQILRSEPHRAIRTVSQEMQALIEKFEVDVPEIKASGNGPLMISSSSLLPNQQVVVVPETASEAEWVTSVHKVWTGLGKPRLRVFLPSSMTTAQFESRWPAKDAAAAAIELVSETRS